MIVCTGVHQFKRQLYIYVQIGMLPLPVTVARGALVRGSLSLKNATILVVTGILVRVSHPNVWILSLCMYKRMRAGGRLMIWVGEVLWGKGVKYFDMGKTGHDLTPPGHLGSILGENSEIPWALGILWKSTSFRVMFFLLSDFF